MLFQKSDFARAILATFLVASACGKSPSRTPGIDEDADGGEGPAAVPAPVGAPDAAKGVAPGPISPTPTPTPAPDAAATSPLADAAVTPQADARGPGPDMSDSGGGPPVGTYVGGAVPYPCKSAFCESFETAQNGTPNPAVWSRTGKPTVETALAFSGTKALHVPAFSGAARHMINTTKMPAELAKTLYGRMFLWLAKAPTDFPTGGNTFHWTMVHTGTGSSDIYLGGVMLPKGVEQLYLNSSPYAVESQAKGMTSVPHMVWHCLEWFFDVGPGEARIWMDDVEITSMAVKGAKSMPTMSSASFGWNEFHTPATPWEVWIDDIAMDSKRIGCAR